MKRNFMILTVLAAALVMLPCCKKDNNTAADENGAKYTINVEMDGPSCDGGEKTHLGPLDMSGQTPVYWSDNDNLAVFDGLRRYNFTLTSGKGQDIGRFSSDYALAANSVYCAFYPYYPDGDDNLKPEASLNGNAYTMTFNLPQQQTYQAPVNGTPTLGEGMLPMIAYSTSSSNFTMFTMMAVLKVDLKGTGMVGKLVLTDGNSNAKLWGTAQVAISGNNDRPTPSSITGGDNTLTLNCPGGVALNKTTATSFYFVVPAGTLGEDGKGFSVTVYNTLGETNQSGFIDMHTVCGNIMKRGVISTLSVDNQMIELPSSVLSGVFSVVRQRKSSFRRVTCRM